MYAGLAGGIQRRIDANSGGRSGDLSAEVLFVRGGGRFLAWDSGEPAPASGSSTRMRPSFRPNPRRSSITESLSAIVQLVPIVSSVDQNSGQPGGRKKSTAATRPRPLPGESR